MSIRHTARGFRLDGLDRSDKAIAAFRQGFNKAGVFSMIAESFVFDTTRIRRQLGWTPTVTNEEMMVRAYKYYAENRNEIHSRTDVSAHSRPTSMGIIRMLKWFS